MDIKRWKVMLAVDDYGSFTRAGEALGYTQSGITQMMKALEKEIGLSLFIKNNHGVTLTDEARSLLPSVRTLLNADETIRQEVSALKGAQTGVIKIGTYLSCSIHWIPKIIREFQRSHPHIHFQVLEGEEGKLAEWISEHRVDIGFLSRQKGQTYSFLPVMDDEMLAVLPKDHPLAALSEIPIENFQGTPFIITADNPGSDIHRILRHHKIRPDIRYVTISEFSALSMVEHDLGVTILPSLVLRGQVGNFVVRKICPNVCRQLGLAYSSSKELSPAAHIFLEYAKDFLLDD